MKVLFTIATKELIGHLVSFRFLISTAIMVILATLATAVGVEDYNQRLEAYQERRAQFESALEQVNVYSFLQPVVLRAPEPLSVLDRGFEARLGDQVRINVFSIPVRASGGSHGNPFMTVFRGLDLTMVVRVVLGLLALLLTFGGLVASRESGNLRLSLAHGVRPTTLIAGIYLGALVAILTALGLGLLSSLSILALRLDTTLTAEHWERVAAIVGVWGLYLIFMLLLGLLLSAITRSAAASLRLSILSWLVIVSLLPQTALLLAGSLAGAGLDPLETEREVAVELSERDARIQEIWLQDPLREKPSVDLATYFQANPNRARLRRYGSAAFYDSVARFHRAEVEIGRAYAEEIYQLKQFYEVRLRRVERLARALASFSPAFLLDRIVESFAGTSIDDQDDFLVQSRRYRERLIGYLERHNAFESWRWFTDDLELQPWPTLFGLRPEEVDPSQLSTLAEGFRSEAYRERVRRDGQDPARRLVLDDLPRFDPPPLDAERALTRVWGSVLALILIDVLLALALLLRVRSASVTSDAGSGR